MTRGQTLSGFKLQTLYFPCSCSCSYSCSCSCPPPPPSCCSCSSSLPPPHPHLPLLLPSPPHSPPSPSSPLFFGGGEICFLMCMCVSVLCLYVCVSHVWSTHRSQEHTGFPRTSITEDCQVPCGCWKLNLGPQEEEPWLLTTEPSF